MVAPGNGDTRCIGDSNPGLPNLLLTSPGVRNTMHEYDLQLLMEMTSQCLKFLLTSCLFEVTSGLGLLTMQLPYTASNC